MTFRVGDDWAVFVADDGRARLQVVDTGRRNGVVAEIRGGLEPGERVIVHPSNRVSDGIRIESRD